AGGGPWGAGVGRWGGGRWGGGARGDAARGNGPDARSAYIAGMIPDAAGLSSAHAGPRCAYR
ncbi:MAG: hypothetical protein ABJA94_11945, partial [Rhodoglobus sp.]